MVVLALIFLIYLVDAFVCAVRLGFNRNAVVFLAASQLNYLYVLDDIAFVFS